MAHTDAKTETELELKFVVPPERLAGVRAALLAGGRTAGAQRVRMQAHYFDTPDGALAAARIALRLRKEGRRWVQTLKAEGASRVQRLEHEVELPGTAAPTLDLALHRGTDAGDALDRALGRHASPPVARYGTDVRRTRRLLDAGGTQVEVALDEGCIVAGERSVAVSELEFELKAGGTAALFELARTWRAAHGLWLSTASKAERGERLASGSPEVPPAKAATPKVDADMDGETLLRAVAASCLDQILVNAGEVASGRHGAEHVHQLRIGIRRLRTALRELGKLSSAVDPAWEAPLAQAFRALGDWRDRDAAAGAVQPRLRAAGAPLVDFPVPAADEVPDPAQAVRADAFQTVLLGVLEFTLAASPAGSDADAARGLVTRRLRKLHRRVVRDGKRFEALDEAARHRARKRLKRLRYLAEAVAPLYGERRVERYLKRLRPAQDALGAHNDAQVALSLYRRAAESDPRAWFAVGWLQAEQGAGALASQRALKAVGKAPAFWRA